jgi:Ca2+-transporting ATPase
VAEAVSEAYQAGIRIIVITGDYPGTAQFIAKRIGIKNADEFLTGADVERLSFSELREKIKTVNIFARVVPEQKLNIVNALKENGEIVAMTGDGVNDAPALKSAHIGIAMGERGTDVAREAASLILLDDDFSSIVAAVRLGRRIYDNIKRAMSYAVTVHVPIAGMAIIPLGLGMPIVLLPAHIAFLELIIDPACSTVFESIEEEKNIMKRPPRNLRASIFNIRTLSISLIQGMTVLFVSFAFFIFAVKTGRGELEARAFAFSSLVIGNLALIAINLSWSRNIHKIIFSFNRITLTVFGISILSLGAVLYVPFFSTLFHMAPLAVKDVATIAVVIFASLMWFEVLKLFKLIK